MHTHIHYQIQSSVFILHFCPNLNGLRFVCFCIGLATGKNSCQFFSSTKKKIIHIIKTAIDINKQAQTATGKKYRERRKIVSKMCISQSKWVDGNVGKQCISLITQLVLTLMTVCLWY